VLQKSLKLVDSKPSSLTDSGPWDAQHKVHPDVGPEVLGYIPIMEALILCSLEFES
jgi:hypothetical protein